jgi:hypothetical protein
MDGTSEEKLFAPGYGEFYTSDASDVEALALAVPTDALPGSIPPELDALYSGALDIFAATGSEEWNAASATVGKMNNAWNAYRTGEVPRKIEPRMSDSLMTLGAAVDDRDTERARQATLDVAGWSLDLRLQYRPQTEVDLARMDLWAARVIIDAAAGDDGAVGGDVFTLGYIRDRILNALDDADTTRVNTAYLKLQVAAADGDLAKASDAAVRLREILQPLRR